MAQGNSFDSMPFIPRQHRDLRPPPPLISPWHIANWQTFQASSFAISCLNAREKIKSASPFPSKSKWILKATEWPGTHAALYTDRVWMKKKIFIYIWKIYPRHVRGVRYCGQKKRKSCRPSHAEQNQKVYRSVSGLFCCLVFVFRN